MIAVVDYGRGNLFSIGQALRHLGCEFETTDDPGRIRRASHVILPGVGAFGDAMANLAERGLVEPLREVASAGTPLLGICVGMQMLADWSEEFGRHKGLGLVPGAVLRLPEPGGGRDAIRIPNVGWRLLHPGPGRDEFDLAQGGGMVYFVHSYGFVPKSPQHVAAVIRTNGTDVAAIVRRDNVVGYQFHPEKSGETGLALLRRFFELTSAGGPSPESNRP